MKSSPVIARMLGLSHGVPHHSVEEDRDNLSHGGAGGGVAGVAGGGHLHRVDPQLVGQVLQLIELVLSSNHGELLSEIIDYNRFFLLVCDEGRLDTILHCSHHPVCYTSSKFHKQCPVSRQYPWLQ